MRKVGIFLLSVAFPAAVFAQPIALNRQFRPDPLRVEGTTTATVSLEELGGAGRGCRGFADRQPNFTLTLGANFPLLDILAFAKDVNADPTMLLMGENGIVVCADNEHAGRNPQIAMRLPQGTYRIWVGSREANRPIDFTLSVSEIRQK
ncbi:MAG: hypothetical protein ACK4QL_07905 [Pseudanabaenaceae cyanobacterium]